MTTHSPVGTVLEVVHLKHLPPRSGLARSLRARTRNAAALAAAVVCAAVAPHATAGLLSLGMRTGAGENGCLTGVALPAPSPVGPLRAEHNCSTAHSNTQAVAEADYGLLRSSVAVQAAPGFSLVTGETVRAEAIGSYVFTGPTPFVTIQWNLDLDGHLGGSAPIGIAFSGLLITLQIPSGSLVTRLVVTDDPTGRSVQLLQNFLDADADWLSLVGSVDARLDLQTLPFVVPTGTPVTLLMQLETSGGCFGNCTMEADFASTLTFNAAGPVFTLPDGYTVNGDGVVNNLWIGSPVPEPSAMAMAALGLLVLLWRRRSTREHSGGEHAW